MKFLEFKEPYEKYVGKWTAYGSGDDHTEKELLVRLVRKDNRVYFSTVSIWGNKAEYNIVYPESNIETIVKEPEEFKIREIEPTEEDRKRVFKFVFVERAPWI